MVLSMEIKFLCHLIMPYFLCPPCVYKKIIIFIFKAQTPEYDEG